MWKSSRFLNLYMLSGSRLWVMDEEGDRETIILMNIKRARLRYWNKKVKTKKPEELAIPSHLF
jgi:hypothetical protein